MIAGIINKVGRATHINPAKPELEKDWRKWLRFYFPYAIKAEFAKWHEEYWDWLWKLEQGKPHPDCDAFFMMVARGAGKTSSGQLGVIALGALKKRHYGWLISRTQKQANDKLLEIREAVGRTKGTAFARDYPGMANVRIDENGHSLGWKATRLYTEDGFVLDALGLDSASRGAKVFFQRPDFFMPDDIDDSKDSPLVVEKNIKTLTQDLLPAGDLKCSAVLGLQNLIHKSSIFSRIADGRAEFLTDRKIACGGPVPAVLNLKTEKIGLKDIIQSGEATWPA